MPDTDTLIRSDLLEKIQRKKERLDAHRPLPESAVRKLRDELRLLHTYHSNAIEGNALTLQETKLVLEEGITIRGKSVNPWTNHLSTIWRYLVVSTSWFPLQN